MRPLRNGRTFDEPARIWEEYRPQDIAEAVRAATAPGDVLRYRALPERRGQETRYVEERCAEDAIERALAALDQHQQPVRIAGPDGTERADIMKTAIGRNEDGDFTVINANRNYLLVRR